MNNFQHLFCKPRRIRIISRQHFTTTGPAKTSMMLLGRWSFFPLQINLLPYGRRSGGVHLKCFLPIFGIGHHIITALAWQVVSLESLYSQYHAQWLSILLSKARLQLRSWQWGEWSLTQILSNHEDATNWVMVVLFIKAISGTSNNRAISIT